MNIPVSELPALFTKYVDAHLMPKLKGTPAAFVLGAGTLLVQQGAHNFVTGEKFLAFTSMLGLIDSAGNFDLDKARDAAIKGMQDAGGKLPVKLWSLPIVGELAYSFDADDIENLYKLAQ